ncbi:FAD-dependent monooxygenase [Flavobacterium kingsejongi]|uniref:FAD-dependent monooxygenase n=1 Tax=Flavobacterium kingsejongi TaxID=1678728 RepID=UPI001D13114A|nr:FAD-dependent monooxygenase [Flavobacterium kingsejongi]
MVGAGPAGLATALALQQYGIYCTIIDNHPEHVVKPGESLPPNANAILNTLGIETLLESPNHNHYVGNTVVWGDGTVRSRYFMNEPYGNGRHLNRIAFETELRNTVQQHNIPLFLDYRLTNITEQEEQLFLNCTTPDGTVRTLKAGFVVDCSGRAAIVAKKMGVKRTTLDTLSAYYCTVPQPGNTLNGMTFIESVEDGWWYAAPIGDNKIIMHFMSDADLHTLKTPDLQYWFQQKIAETQHLNTLIHPDISMATAITIKTATTAILEQPCGPRWLAVGDALCSYDPLTSFGITNALAGGHAAAQAIEKLFNGDSSGISDYCQQQISVFDKSVAMLQNQYKMEQRWPSAPFWERRH